MYCVLAFPSFHVLPDLMHSTDLDKVDVYIGRGDLDNAFVAMALDCLWVRATMLAFLHPQFEYLRVALALVLESEKKFLRAFEKDPGSSPSTTKKVAKADCDQLLPSQQASIGSGAQDGK